MPRVKPDCCKCGVCCVALSTQSVFADVDADDIVSLRKTLGAREFRKAVHETSAFDMLALTLSNQYTPAGAIHTKELTDHEGHDVCACTFLDGTPGKKVHCRIYKDRPKVCRTAVTPGDKTCMALRKAHKLGGPSARKSTRAR